MASDRTELAIDVVNADQATFPDIAAAPGASPVPGRHAHRLGDSRARLIPDAAWCVMGKVCWQSCGMDVRMDRDYLELPARVKSDLRITQAPAIRLLASGKVLGLK